MSCALSENRGDKKKTSYCDVQCVGSVICRKWQNCVFLSTGTYMQMCLCLIVSAGIRTVRVCARLSLCECSVFVNVCTCEMARREKESERECVSM